MLEQTCLRRFFNPRFCALSFTYFSFMNRPKLLGAFLFFLTFSTLSLANGAEKLKNFLDNTQSFRADFSQVVAGNNNANKQSALGKMAFLRPGKFRWEIEKPYQQLLVGDGKEVWIFDPDLRQATVKPMNLALGNTPAALLTDKNAFTKNFTIRNLGEKDGFDWALATPKSADSGFEKLQLGFLGNELVAMQLFDSFGQITTLAFGKIEKNVHLPAALFTFQPPANVDVIRE